MVALCCSTFVPASITCPSATPALPLKEKTSRKKAGLCVDVCLAQSFMEECGGEGEQL